MGKKKGVEREKQIKEWYEMYKAYQKSGKSVSEWCAEKGTREISAGETLFNEAEKESDAAAEEPTKETLAAAHKRKAKRTKKELTEDLKHIKEVIKLEEPVCEICVGELTPIGEEFVRSELNIIPAQ
ncbi:MAG: hypothetical protein LUC97_09420, partial [Clostridiales bacterium]|nr:hypothetical protein [Clostridiales bacterium]